MAGGRVPALISGSSWRGHDGTPERIRGTAWAANRRSPNVGQSRRGHRHTRDSNAEPGPPGWAGPGYPPVIRAPPSPGTSRSTRSDGARSHGYRPSSPG